MATTAVRARLHELIGSGASDAWDQTYKEGTTPWDAKQPQPALLELLKGDVVPRTGTAIVPGCGVGYDAYALAQHGLDATGLDISPTALDAARQWVSTQPAPGGALDFRTDDFFGERSLGPFDVAYDVTFFCVRRYACPSADAAQAFHPARRDEIARRYAQLVKPDGILITLQFPLDEGESTAGPPWNVTPEAYQRSFGSRFTQIPGIDIKASLPARKDRERLVVWRRKA